MLLILGYPEEYSRPHTTQWSTTDQRNPCQGYWAMAQQWEVVNFQ
ncbi:hypothetical protein [Synechocystis salina]|nr:hypothetical protein [Synechocystis salina]